MLSGRPFTDRYLSAMIAGFVVIVLGSCTIVKNYQPGKPFVYRTNINLIGNFSNEEKKDLQNGLQQQLDDSMQVRKVEKLFWSVQKTPPVYDPANADKSITFMEALLRSQGYFSDSIYYDDSIKQVGKDQYRATINFFVRPGKLVHLDTVAYNLRHPELQYLADSAKKEALVKKGDPFAKIPISAELDRLTELYRNNGYFRFNRDELIGLWDTLDVSLLRPTIDPFEQLEILQKLQQRRDTPTANLEIRLRNYDSSRLVKYYVGNVTIYPDITPDTAGMTPKVKVVGKDNIRVVQYHNWFKAKIFPPNIYLPHDSVYRMRRYIRTLNQLNSLGAWRMVNIDQVARANTDTVDFIIRMTPAKKYAFNTNLEGSINQSAISGNLFGIGVNVGLQNRNFAKGANLTNTNVRYGIELGNTGSSQFIQSQQASFSHTIYFPRFIPNTNLIREQFRDNWRTLFSFNLANTERRLLYNLTTINGAWGYEFQRRNIRKGNNWLLTFKLPNIEYSYLIKRDSLNTLIANNPSLRNIFTDGFISSVIGNATNSWGKTRMSGSGRKTSTLNFFKTNLEESGLLTGLLRNDFLDKELYRFVKLDAEYAHLIRFTKSSIALRAFGGIGYEFDFTRNPDKRNNLPFFKQYFAGGPNSMRAWALRRLGPGSAIKEFTGSNGIPDRYGDLQLEANAEYRFPIGAPFGIQINGALFTDIGNVWFLKSAAGHPEEVFKFSRLGKDLAVGAGAGLRFDLNFFVIRFDYSYKVKDPSPAPADAALQNKWFGYKFFKGDQFQLGIGYPFIF